MSEQITGLITDYGVTAAGMLVGLLIMRAAGRAYWRWPVYSVMVMVLGVVLWNLSRKYWLPPAWVLVHGRALYIAALGLYAVLGVGMGILLGRLTRSKI